MREILIACTFREFNGDVNAQTQELFLQSLKNQTYQNYRLVVTNFGEKFVKKKLQELNLPFEFHQSRQQVRSSWSEVIANTFPYLQEGNHIILWTNADIAYDKNFFQKMIELFEPRIGGTSYPAIHYSDQKSFFEKKPFDPYYNQKLKTIYDYDPNIFIPEAMYVDGDVFLDSENERLFLDHMISGHAPGIVVTLMFGFFCKKLINIIHHAKMHTITSIKPKDYHLDAVHDMNYEKMIGFCEKRHFHKKYYKGTVLCTRKIFLAKSYQLVGNFWQRLMYQLYFFYYTIRPRRSLIVFNRVRGLARKLRWI